MFARLSKAPWSVFLCLLPLLLAQVLGVHHHQHLELEAGALHRAEVHLGDAGLHHLGSTAATVDDHGHAGSTHAHVDIDRPVVSHLLLKVFVDLLSVGIALFLAFILWRPTRVRQSQQRTSSVPRRHPPRYLQGPPALAPPR